MASTSTSSIQKNFKYDVFLSFRGEDTRKNFVDHLYSALTQKGIETYKDAEKIKKGNRINDELIEAIEDSKFYLIIFSKNYASSSWCLEELVKIMECQTMDEHTAYPVFYDVEPTEVRKQSGSVGDAFAKHKEEKAARKWREALKEASDLAGWELKSIWFIFSIRPSGKVLGFLTRGQWFKPTSLGVCIWGWLGGRVGKASGINLVRLRTSESNTLTLPGHEARFIQKIVKEISLELSFINSSVDGNLIGMDTRVNEVISSLEPGVSDVRMLGIWGMGGAGKTTLARAVFDQISFQFEGHSFVENVREESKPSLSGLKSLQKQVLSDISNDQGVTVSGVLDGKNKMKKTMCCRKVLVVLDDVDHKDQLEALAGDRNWFKPGSRIIITTRDEQVLVAHRVSLIHNVTLLSQAEAGCLFSRYAFGRENPIQGYEELSGKVLKYADGLPLTIKVMGSFLCGQNEAYWINAIERLKTIPLTATMDRLEISFDGLEKEYKEIFLDVACIINGLGKEDAIRVLESRGFHAEVGLRVLEHKSLITISEFGSLGMHDHLREMGRNIVRRLHPDEPNKHSRLWIDKEIKYILTNDLGTQATKCLCLRSPGFSAEIAIKGLAKMKDLRFIEMCLVNEYNLFGTNFDYVFVNLNFDKVSEYLPSSLRFMRWWNFPFSSLPNTFDGKYLVELHIFLSNIVQLWKDGEEKVLHKLRFFTIRLSKLRTFDLWLAPNLESLTILSCRDFVELHIPAHHRLKLKYVNISCSKLKTIELMNSPNLEKLILRDCKDLAELQMPAESLKLEYLDLSNSKLTNLHLGNTPNIKTLQLQGCQYLVEFQMPAESLKLEHLDLNHSKLTNLHLGNTPNLEKLTLRSCFHLVELQMPAESLKLEHLDLSGSQLTNLHLRNTPNLKTLELQGCHKLEEFQMHAECLKLEHLDLSDSKLTNLHLGNTPNLKKLKLERCHDLVELQMPTKSLKLKHLDLSHSKLTNLHLGNTPNLKKLTLQSCGNLVDLHMPAESLKLERLNLSYSSEFKNLHLGNTPNLKTLELRYCHDLVEFQMHAESLEYLDLSYTKLTNFHLGNTPNLKRLLLGGCNDLVEFQTPAQSLKLEYLDLSHIELTNLDLRNIPNLKTLVFRYYDSVEFQMPAQSLKLEHLDLSDSKVTNLHLGNTPNLQTLELQGCHDLVEFQMSAQSLKLEQLDLSHSKLTNLHLGNTPNLLKLTLRSCIHLVELQMPAESLKLERLNLSGSQLTNLHLRNTPNLKTLELQGCQKLVEFQMHAECLKLEHLDLSDSKLTNLHLGNTPNLKKLKLERSHDMVELQMPTKSLKLEHLDLSHSQLTNLHLGNTPNLKNLTLRSCGNLVELQMPAESLKLEHLDLSDSKLTNLHLGNSPNLKTLVLSGCNDLVEFQTPAQCLKLEYLHDLSLIELINLDLGDSKLTNLHIRNTPILKNLTLRSCGNLVEFRMHAESLKLKHLDLSDSKLTNLRLGNTPNLMTLVLHGCNDLVEFQMPSESLMLQYLDLSDTKLTNLHLANTPNLKTLVLYGCNDLVEFQMSSESLKLEYLDLSESKLTNFHLGNTPNLKMLELKGYHDLVEFQLPTESLKLKHLDLSHSKLKTIHLGSTPNLEELILKGCNDLVELQMPAESLKLAVLDLGHSKLTYLYLGNFPNLKKLILEGCKDVVELQMPVDCLKLEYLDLSHTKLKTIDLRNSPNLEKLILKGCNDLVQVQKSAKSLKLVYLDLGHSNAGTLDLRLAPNLERLNLESCYLAELIAPIGCLKKLVFLDLSGCGRFKSFWFDKKLDKHHDSLSELHLIAEPIDVCPLHSDNKFPKLKFSCFYKEDPASSFGNLETLISIGLCACTNLERFSRSICSLQCIRKLTLEGSITESPWDLDQLECLEELTFSSTEIKYLPDSICKLKHLKSLELKSCLLLEKLPDDLGQIESLETLIITECNLLRDIPNNIGIVDSFHVDMTASFDATNSASLLQYMELLSCSSVETALLMKKVLHATIVRQLEISELMDNLQQSKFCASKLHDLQTEASLAVSLHGVKKLGYVHKHIDWCSLYIVNVIIGWS
ncbi:Toll/interleukin-1 receptor domain-containing protein [Tanacetum coccineum]|uniref:Toll/interleukin-1 receptor domain-containing protein n=1 Tax=Tanacetum coccineum TaxID=301880 RepID=A0ABQ5EZ29_9ASTR